MRNPWFGIYILLVLLSITVFFFLFSLFPTRTVTFTDTWEEETTPKVSDDDPVLGEAPRTWFWTTPPTKVVFIFYGDFTSDSSAKTLSSLLKIYDDLADEMTIVWKNFPNPTINLESLRSAVAAECANNQNKFWEYARLLSENRRLAGTELYQEIADDLRLSSWKFKRCLSSKKTLEQIENDYNEALGLEISTAPSIYVAGKWYTGELSETEIRSIMLDIKNAPK